MVKVLQVIAICGGLFFAFAIVVTVNTKPVDLAVEDQQVCEQVYGKYNEEAVMRCKFIRLGKRYNDNQIQLAKEAGVN